LELVLLAGVPLLEQPLVAIVEASSPAPKIPISPCRM
jgi:hypothetical protein